MKKEHDEKMKKEHDEKMKKEHDEKTKKENEKKENGKKEHGKKVKKESNETFQMMTVKSYFVTNGFLRFMNLLLFLSIEDEEDEEDEDSPPPQFEKMTNQFQVCNWLVKRPNILRLANDMLAAKKSKTLQIPSQNPSQTPPQTSSVKVSNHEKILNLLKLE
jgi:hypothetical protein